MSFTLIETQEQFDAAIKDRLERAERKTQEKYAGYISPDELESKTKELNNKIAELSKSLNDANEAINKANEKAKADADAIAGLQTQVKGYETASVKSRIAHEVGIPFELANKLSGETEEDIRKDAETLKPFVSQTVTAPLRNPEAGGGVPSTRDQFAEWAKANMA